MLFYTLLFQQVIKRFLRMDFNCPQNAYMLHRVTKVRINYLFLFIYFIFIHLFFFYKILFLFKTLPNLFNALQYIYLEKIDVIDV